MYDGNPGEIDFVLSLGEVQVSEGSSYWEQTKWQLLSIYVAKLLENRPLQNTRSASRKRLTAGC